MTQIIITLKEQKPYYCIKVNLDRLKELNGDPNLWAELMSSIEGKLFDGKETEYPIITRYTMVSEIDSALAGLITSHPYFVSQQNPSQPKPLTIRLYDYEVEIKFNDKSVYIIFKKEDWTTLPCETF